MTGWRIGVDIVAGECRQGEADLQSQETSNPCSVSQYAALAALTRPATVRRSDAAEFAKRREFVQRRMHRSRVEMHRGWPVAFYVFINIKPPLGPQVPGRSSQ